MKKAKVLVLRSAGTNCDKETFFAFKSCGADVESAHINTVKNKMVRFADHHILALPGGFSYGDDIAAGKVLANELKYKLQDEIIKFIKQGGLIIGICNGFQVLVKSGLLPGNDSLSQEATLTVNDSGKFEDRWVYLKNTHAEDSPCVWTRGLPKVVYLPVAHGEGKFLVKDNGVLERLRIDKQIVFQYCDERSHLSGYPDNPNGSIEHIAGICDKTGRIFGLMPHPERHIHFTQHPRWTRFSFNKHLDGIMIFQNAVSYARKVLC